MQKNTRIIGRVYHLRTPPRGQGIHHSEDRDISDMDKIKAQELFDVVRASFDGTTQHKIKTTDTEEVKIDMENRINHFAYFRKGRKKMRLSYTSRNPKPKGIQSRHQYPTGKE
jgi:hypothetical protein